MRVYYISIFIFLSVCFTELDAENKIQGAFVCKATTPDNKAKPKKTQRQRGRGRAGERENEIKKVDTVAVVSVVCSFVLLWQNGFNKNTK